MNSINCYHCGDDCSPTPIVHLEHDFCCQGCATVFTLLSDAGLSEYYDTNAGPGTRRIDELSNQWLDALDLPEIRNQWVVFEQGSWVRIHLQVPAIHCSSCVWLLEKVPDLYDGIRKSHVNFADKSIHLVFDESVISLKNVIIGLDRLGYRPVLEKPGTKGEQKKDRRRSMLQIAVAGFCFGNLMFLAFPDYLGAVQTDSPELATVFRYLSLAFCFPVLLFSAQPFLKGAWSSITSRTLNIDVPIALGIFVLFGRTLSEVLSETSTGYGDSLAGLVFFLLIGRWYQSKTYRALSFGRKANDYLPLVATQLTDQGQKVIPVEEVQIGMHILIRNNYVIPVDAVLVDGQGSIDYSFVTGESTRITTQVGAHLQAGGRYMGQPITACVSKTYASSYLVQLWNESMAEKGEQGSLSQLLQKVGRVFTWSILAIAVLSFTAWAVVDVNMALDVLTAVLIIACPCALALSTPFVFGTASRLLANHGLFLKSTAVVEGLSLIEEVIYDKTGTLTVPSSDTVIWVGERLTAYEQAAVKSLASQSIHPNSQAIVRTIMEDRRVRFAEVKEWPGKGIEGRGELNVLLGSSQWIGGDAMSEGGTILKIGGRVKGYFEISRTWRPGWKQGLERMKKRVNIHLLSGDSLQQEFLQTNMVLAHQVHFNCAPSDKVNYLRRLNQQGKMTLMLGDGINDAPALQTANIGIAVAEGQFQFTPAADAIIKGDVVVELDHFLAFARSTRRLVKWCVGISVAYNVVGLTFAIQGLLSPVVAAVLMPASSLSIIALATVGVHRLAQRKLVFRKTDKSHFLD